VGTECRLQEDSLANAMRVAVLFAAMSCVSCDTSVVLPLPAGMCVVTLGHEFYSPTRTMKAVVYDRRCGSEESLKNVSIMAATAHLENAPGNALIEQSVAGAQSRTANIELEWHGESAIRISRNPSMRTALTATQANGVSINHGVDPDLEAALK
jgi:hypothetical protein